MVSQVSYPGVYIQELESGVRTISGVPTSTTAFVGRARRGPINDPTTVHGTADFQRLFGGLWQASTMSYAVRHFFLNGGGEALIVRVHSATGATVEDDCATVTLPPGLQLRAASPGIWGNNLRAGVAFPTDLADTEHFHLTLQEVNPLKPTEVVAEEVFHNLSVDPLSPRDIAKVLEQESALARLVTPAPLLRPDAADPTTFGGGNDGNDIQDSDITGNPADKTGYWALEKADIFNLLCIPPPTPDANVQMGTWDEAAAFCVAHRAMLIVDPPIAWNEPSDVDANAIGTVVTRSPNAAMYFPRILAADPLKDNRLEEFPPSGAVAGVIARIDATRGFWKAPAGQEAVIFGAQKLTVRLTDPENGDINPLGVNCLRTFPIPGRVVWGARTLMGADEQASQWKYLPVRRTALYIEESLYRGTQWVVFEGNDEKLWSQIRMNVGSFMQDLFRQGAFQGTSPREAYFVKCDRETTTQSDIDRGIVNVVVGFAPLKPAEFVVIKIQQLAQQSAA